jgi:hypothetical protein
MSTLPIIPVNPVPTLLWVGWSGTVYEFERDPLGTQYNRRPGVYIICRQMPDGTWFADYVGETDDFHRRLFEEFAGHGFREGITAPFATHICTLHVTGGKAARLAVETDLRHSLNPPCNKQ